MLDALHADVLRLLPATEARKAFDDGRRSLGARKGSERTAQKAGSLFFPEGELNRSIQFIPNSFERGSVGLENAHPMSIRPCSPIADRCAMPPTHSTGKRRHPTG